MSMSPMAVAPCLRSGMCCQTAPCGYGEAVPGGRACRYLAVDGEVAPGVKVYRCERYDWIKQNVANWHSYPAFGAGCSSTLFNRNRQAIREVQASGRIVSGP